MLLPNYTCTKDCNKKLFKLFMSFKMNVWQLNPVIIEYTSCLRDTAQIWRCADQLELIVIQNIHDYNKGDKLLCSLL